jgi:hypothetical protein
LRLAFFVAGDVRGRPLNEFLETAFAIGRHSLNIHD